ncbi:ER membrane protein complex subunit 7, beta-sandwich domain [Popillia japonica]|uniref:ER membrane protein complex subunit 7, beta-sandwich domain n=1 Tax=Popillia japonica TaxID=7064 RepID=A0AAW1LQJ4_POPJA
MTENGFVKEDGTFIIHNIPSGSYIVEALNSELTYELVRVEINSKGRTKYFQIREQWRVTDFLLNPMVLMMVLPLLLIMVLPKMMNDPETKKEMEQFGSLKFPGVSDMVTNIFAGAPPNPQQPKKALKTKKRQ